MKNMTQKPDHVLKTRESLQTFCTALSPGHIPGDAQTRFRLPSDPGNQRIDEILQAMDRQERHRLKRWLDDCFAQKKILSLPAEEHFVPTPPPPPPSERPSRYGGHWWD